MLTLKITLQEVVAYVKGLVPVHNKTHKMCLDGDEIALSDITALLNLSQPTSGALGMGVTARGIVPLSGSFILPQASINMWSGRKNTPTASGLSLGSSVMGGLELNATLA